MNKLHSALLAGATLLLVPSAAMAQDAPVPAPAVVETQATAPTAAEAVLPANTEVVLTVNEAVTSSSHRQGDKFGMTVAQDVMANGAVVIPRGTRAVGQVVWRTGKGSFGKSGKMDVRFRYIDYNGQQIPLDGRHYQAGEGRTAATVGAVVAAGIVGGLVVKGKNARIDQGREFTARTLEAIPLTVSEGGPAVIAASYVPSRVSMGVESPKQRKAREKAERAAGKGSNR
ncbi:MAG TPA: hypothetical protein VEA61_06620 [Allosphingosinicella sp.]|nr:hypothetical protein [Allosphingosinicella sp.]